MIKRAVNYIREKIIYRNLTLNFRYLYFSRITINSATQLMGLFLPIFLYQFLGFNIFLVVLYYLILDVLYCSLVIWACRFAINKFGIKLSLQISVFFGAIYYFIFFLINQYANLGGELFSTNHLLYLAPALFFSLMFRLTHWIPYHTNLAKLTEKNIRARQLSLMEATMMALGAVMPLIAGFVLDNLGYSYLFALAMSVYLLAIWPFSFLPKIFEKFSWSHKKTWQVLFSKKMRPSILAYIGDGAEGIVGVVIWPIFIWQILEGNYFQVGLISSLIIFTTILLQIVIGRFIDKAQNRRRLLRYGAIFYSFGWVLKVLINSSFQIFLFSTYHNLSRVFSRTSFDTMNYDIAADQGCYVDEYTAVREIAVLLGKILMAILIIIILPYFSLRYIFVIAALASLLMSLLKQVEAISD